MAKQAINLFFPQNLIKEPIMYLVARDFDLMLNIRRAKITAESGEATIELEGDEKNIKEAVAMFKKKGVIVNPVVGDVVQ